MIAEDWQSERSTILVGEVNPYGANSGYALYPLPENSAGGRLCRLIMRMEPRAYIRRFDRRNLCIGKWQLSAARDEAARITAEVQDNADLVLMGARVCSAFRLKYEPFTIINADDRAVLVILPHPSGLCRLWNEPGAFERARSVLIKAGVLNQQEGKRGQEEAG